MCPPFVVSDPQPRDLLWVISRNIAGLSGIGLDVIKFFAVDQSPALFEHGTVEKRLRVVHLALAFDVELRVLCEMNAAIGPPRLVSQQGS